MAQLAPLVLQVQPARLVRQDRPETPARLALRGQLVPLERPEQRVTLALLVLRVRQGLREPLEQPGRMARPGPLVRREPLGPRVRLAQADLSIPDGSAPVS